MSQPPLPLLQLQSNCQQQPVQKKDRCLAAAKRKRRWLWWNQWLCMRWLTVSSRMLPVTLATGLLDEDTSAQRSS